jgi:tyrosinase
MWQTMNGDMWLNSKDDQALLNPFYQDTESHVWTSAETRRTTKFNYTYDTMLDALQENCRNSDGSINEEAWSQNLRTSINGLYGGPAQAAALVPDEVAKTQDFDDYVINIIYDRYALDGTAYSIDFFTGNPPAFAAQTALDKNFVGRLYTFSYRALDDADDDADENGSAGAGVACPNCKQQQAAGVLSAGQIPLTIPLMAQAANPEPAYEEITSVRAAKRKEVEEYLAKYLAWQYSRTGSGVLSSNFKFPKTKVFVLRRNSSVKMDGEKAPATPVYGEYQVLVGVTQGKEGGATVGDCEQYFPGITQVL